METLMVSVSGIRGIVGQSLTPTVVAEFAAAYGSPRTGQKILVSRDGRSTGEMFRDAAVAGLLAVGCKVVDLGIASTPTCGFLTKTFAAAGAIQITASHNPPEWNGLKLYRPEGFVLGPEAGQKVADDYRNCLRGYVSWDRIHAVESIDDPSGPHLERVLSLVNVNEIRKRGFRVVLDANHGSGATFGPRLLEALGCKVTVLGGVADGRFEHPPEPTEANLGGLCDAVKQSAADIGFATDPDADRLALVDETGRYPGEEYTLALAIGRRCGQTKGPVIINGSTSRLSADAATLAGCPFHRTKVGEVHVAERMIAERAVIGGEGNGGVIDPRVGFGRDSAVGIAIILDLLAASEKPLSALVDALPRYAIRKDKFPIDRENLAEALSKTKREFADGRIDETDGLRVDWDDAWVQLRASNTEPIVRVIAEAKDQKRADSLCERVARIVV